LDRRRLSTVISTSHAISVGASAIVLGGLAGVQYLRTQPIEASGVAVTSVQALEAFAPAGSVNAQQVPTAPVVLTAQAPRWFPGGCAVVRVGRVERV
jgi:hypothetical protein